MSGKVGGKILARRPMLEVDVQLVAAPSVLSAGVGDLMHPHRVTFRYLTRSDGTAGELELPVTVIGRAVAARYPGGCARQVTYLTASSMPTWLLYLSQWARDRPA